MKNYIICLISMMAAAGTASGQDPAQSQVSVITSQQFINQAALAGMKEVAAGKIAMQKAQQTKLKDYGALMTQEHDKANAELSAIATSKNIELPSQTDTTAVSTGSGNVGNRPATDGTQTGISRANGTAISANTTGSTTGSSGLAAGSTQTATIAPDAAAVTNKDSNAKKQKKGQHHSGAKMADNDARAVQLITEADVSSALKQLYSLNGAEFDAAYTQMMIADHKNVIALFKQGAQSSDPEIKAFARKQLPALRSHLQQIQDISSTAKSGQ